MNGKSMVLGKALHFLLLLKTQKKEASAVHTVSI